VNIGEATATMRVLDFLAGDVDHCDETTRRALARDLVWLQTRARAAVHAGRTYDEDAWDLALAQVTFEPEPSFARGDA